MIGDRTSQQYTKQAIALPNLSKPIALDFQDSRYTLVKYPGLVSLLPVKLSNKIDD
jgi:hypothetical protein